MANSNSRSDLKSKQLNLLTTELNNMRLKQQFIDVILIDQDQNEYPANKNVLAASSAYFSENFTQPKQFAGAGDGSCVDKFQLPFGVSSKTLQVILQFSYTGILEVSDDDTELIQDLLTSSELLHFELLGQYCSRLIFSELTPENFLVHWQYAEKCKNEEKKQEIAKIMANNFKQISQSDDFLEASADCIKLMLEQEDLKTQTQDVVFEALLKWVNKDIDGRQNNFGSLLDKIIWGNLSDDFLDSLDEKEPELIGKSKDLMMRTLKEVSRRLKNPGCRQKQETPVPTPVLVQNTAIVNVPHIKPNYAQSNPQFPQINPSLNETNATKIDEHGQFNSRKFVPGQNPNANPFFLFYRPQQLVPCADFTNTKPIPQFMQENRDKRNIKQYNQNFERYPPKPSYSPRPKSEIGMSNRNEIPREYKAPENKVDSFQPVKERDRRDFETCSNDGTHHNPREVPKSKSDGFQPNRNNNQRDFNVPTNKGDNYHSNRNQNQRQATPRRNKNDRFQPNLNHNPREAQPPRKKCSEFQPTGKQLPPTGIKTDQMQPSNTSNQQQAQSPRSIENTVNHKQEIVQTSPFEAKKPETKPAEAIKPETKPSAAKKPEIKAIQVQIPQFLPVKAKILEIQSDTPKKAEIQSIKKVEDRFDYFKAKAETVQSIFDGNPNNNDASNCLNHTSEEIVLLKMLDENTEVTIIDTDGNDKTSEIHEIKLPHDAAICCLKNQIYVLGGRHDSGEVLPTFLVFDLDARNWEVLADITVGRCEAGATALDDSVYVVGGLGDENQSLCLVECYNLITKEWCEVAPMKIPRVKPAVSNFKNCLYVCGGDAVSSDNSKTSGILGVFASCEIYNLKFKQWNCLQTKLPIQRSLCAFTCTVMKGKVYAVHAFRNEEKWVLYQYDPRINLWQEILIDEAKMHSWVSIGTLGDEELCFMDDEGGIFKYKLRNRPIQVRNGIAGGKNVSYAVVSS